MHGDLSRDSGGDERGAAFLEQFDGILKCLLDFCDACPLPGKLHDDGFLLLGRRDREFDGQEVFGIEA